MSWHIDADVFSLLIMLIIYFDIRRKNCVSLFSDRIFRALATVTVVASAADICARIIMMNGTHNLLSYCIIWFYYLIVPVVPLFWFFYAYSLSHLDISKKIHIRFSLASLPYIAYAILTAVAFVIGRGKFNEAVMYIAVVGIFAVYSAAMASIMFFDKNRSNSVYLRILFLVFALLSCTAVIYQARNNSNNRLLVVLPCYALMYLVSYITVQNRNRNFDVLTGLLNYQAGEQKINDYLSICTDENQVTFILVNTDNFRSYNEIMGTEQGDKALKNISTALTHVFPMNSIIVRTAGDEFAVFFAGEMKKDKIRERISQLTSMLVSTNIDIYRVPLSYSIGVCYFPEHGRIFSELYSVAKFSVSQSKKNGKSQIVFYSEIDSDALNGMKSKAIEEEIESEMEDALKNGEFVVNYQPEYDLRSGRVIGLEALIRWNHPKKGLLTPDYFISVFEKDGFIQNIDMFVFEEVCKVIDEVRSVVGGVRIPINFSRRHLVDYHFAEKLLSIAKKYNVSPKLITVEILENSIMEKPDVAIEQLKVLSEMGFTVALDDFGIGYSSMAALRRLPIDILKIDRSFLQGDCFDKKNVMLLNSIVYMAGVLGVQVICEGVETAEHDKLMREVGCYLVQGYYYCMPAPIDEILPRIKKENATHEATKSFASDSTYKTELRIGFFSELAETVPTGICSFNRSGDILFANSHYYYMLGYNPGELTKITDVVLPEVFKNCVVQLDKLAGTDNNTYETIIHHKKKDGSTVLFKVRMAINGSQTLDATAVIIEIE